MAKNQGSYFEEERTFWIKRLGLPPSFYFHGGFSGNFFGESCSYKF